MAMSFQGIYNVLNKYKANGIEGLLLGKAKGRERKMNAEQEAELRKIHHANLLKDLLEANPRLHLEFLPPYSPNLNKIEELWDGLKSSVINNVFFHNREEIRTAVMQFIDSINSIPLTVIDRLCL